MIYYVEDDQNIRELALYTLQQAGLEAQGFPSADPFFSACATRVPEVVLLDIMLPDTDGIEILRQMREMPTLRHVPVMMLTAKGTEIDTVRGLDAGADDYLAKPFGLMELVSRVRALMRRAQIPARAARASFECGSIVLNAEAHRVTVGPEETEVVLTLKEFELLQELMSNAGTVLSRSQLLERVWGWDFAGNTRTLDVHVQTLRQKLSDAFPGADSCIETVRGVGYMLKACE